MHETALNLGCGRKHRAGAVNLDRPAASSPDVVHDLDIRPWPFADNRFDQVYAFDVIEHLADLVGVMEELHRICRDGASIEISVPHFSSANAFTDPTPRHFFSRFSFDYFDSTAKVTLSLGVFGNQRFGSDSAFELVRPIIALRVAGKHSTFVFGTLPPSHPGVPPGPDRTGPHGLLPPIQRETLAFERPYEAGMQWNFTSTAVEHEAWLHWQRLNTAEHRERLDAGARVDWRLDAPVSVPFQAHIVHEGDSCSTQDRCATASRSPRGLLCRTVVRRRTRRRWWVRWNCSVSGPTTRRIVNRPNAPATGARSSAGRRPNAGPGARTSSSGAAMISSRTKGTRTTSPCAGTGRAIGHARLFGSRCDANLPPRAADADRNVVPVSSRRGSLRVLVSRVGSSTWWPG
jgi:Methyltransferase domain